MALSRLTSWSVFAGLCFLSLLSFSFFIQPQHDKDACSQLASNPLQADAYYRCALSLSNEQEQSLLFKTAVKLDPQNILYLLALSQTEAVSGDSTEALKNFEAALNANDGSVFTYFLASRFNGNIMDNVIETALNKKIAEEPAQAKWYGYLADWHRYNNRPENAAEAAANGYQKTGAAYLKDIRDRSLWLKEKGLIGP
jgi:predicted Zn-dependent protease